MSKLSNFMIYLNNLSDIYMLSTATVALVIIITIYCTSIMNRKLNSKRKSKKNQESLDQNEIDDDSEDDDPTERELMGKLKTARLKEIEKTLTQDQIEEERRIEQEQLAAIYELLKKQELELNTTEINENELREQLNLYR